MVDGVVETENAMFGCMLAWEMGRAKFLSVFECVCALAAEYGNIR